MAKTVNRKLPTEKSENKIKEAIDSDPRYTISALLQMHKYHSTGTSKWTPADTPLLGGFAQQYERTHSLLKKQLLQARTRLKKYAPVIAKTGGLEPVLLNTDKEGMITTKNNRLLVKFDNRVLYGYLVDTMKSLNNYRFNRADESWTVPCTAFNLEVLFGLGFKWKVSDGVYDFYKSQIKKKKKIKIKNISMPLREYQEEGLKYISAKDGKALVAFDCGLGKTPVSIAYVASKDLYPAIIVCPASLKLNWRKEILRWDSTVSDNEIEIISGLKTRNINKKSKYVIINYDIIHEWRYALRSIDAQTIIIDEVQYIKTSKRRVKVSNPKPGQKRTMNVPVKRTEGTFTVAKGIPNRIGLSGTPIENRVIEFYNILNLLRPDLVSSMWKFAYRYADLKPNKYGMGWDFSGRSNTGELNRVLTKLVMTRKRKEDVLKELPNINRIMVPIEMDQKTWKQYITVENDFIDFLLDKYKNLPMHKVINKANVLTKMNELRKLCFQGKQKGAINWVNDQLESIDKLVAFTYHREVADQMIKQFKKSSVHILGGMSASHKDSAITEFQKCENCGILHHYHDHDKRACDEFMPNSKTPLMIANLVAASEGLTMTAASNAAMIEYQYNPARLSQAESRIHRMGQKEKVNIWYLVAQGTVEESIIASLDQKLKTVSEVVDGEETDGLVLGEALDSLVSKRQ